MKSKRILLPFLFAAANFFSFFIFQFAAANQTDNGSIQFAYASNHFNGIEYASAFIPQTTDAVYLLADHLSILAAKETEVYYWAITNTQKPDWEKRNLNIAGTIEVLQKGKIIQEIDQTDYVIQYDGLDKVNTFVILLNEKARNARKRYETLRKEYQESAIRFLNETTLYEKNYAEALSQYEQGKISADQLPKKPEPSADFTLFSSELLKGYPITLPAGEYTLRLRLLNGEIQAGSEKKLIIFAPIASSIGYKVASEARWNLAETNDDPAQTIYVSPHETLFITPYREMICNEKYYTRMNNPQDQTARDDKVIRILQTPIQTGALQITDGTWEQQLPLEGFYVHQRKGSKLGYDILPFDSETMKEVSFTAVKVNLPTASNYHFQWVDEMGKTTQGSGRNLRVLRSPSRGIFLIIPLFLLITGLTIFLNRKMNSKINTKGSA